jgi:hypothetical protein
MLSVQDVQEFLALGHELRSFEVKGPGSRRDGPYCATVARAAMAMGNLKDGGVICLGVDDTRMVEMQPGLSSQQLEEWSDFDEVNVALSRFADPPLTLHVNPLRLDSGANVVIIEVDEFDDVPHVCKRDFQEKLRDGMTYYRPRGKPESVPVPSASAMHELLDLAIAKGVRKFIERAGSAGLLQTSGEPHEATDREAYDREASVAWSADGPVAERISQSGRFDVALRPGSFDEHRVRPGTLDQLVVDHAVRKRGWPLPYVDPREPILRFGTWIGQDIEPSVVPHIEAWRMCTSGQFLHRRILTTDLADSSQLAPTSSVATGAVAVWDVLLYLVELAELAARLGQALQSATMSLSVALRGIAGRELISGDWERDLHGPYIVQADVLVAESKLGTSSLVADPLTVGVSLAQQLLGQFGLDVPDQLLRDWQAQVFNR